MQTVRPLAWGLFPILTKTAVRRGDQKSNPIQVYLDLQSTKNTEDD